MQQATPDCHHRVVVTVRETDVQRSILARWGAHPRVRLFRANTGDSFRRGRGGAVYKVKGMPEGYPDLTGWVTVDGVGVALLIEVKRPGGRRRDAQKTFAEVARRMGVIHIWAESVEDVDRVLGPLVG